MKRIKYIYISSHEYTSAVYQTQVIDWLNLYRDNGIVFDLWHVFNLSRVTNKVIKYRKTQMGLIANAYKGDVCKTFLTSRFPFISKHLLYHYIKKRCKNVDKVVVFSRAPIGLEVEYVKKQMGDRFIYYLDLRAATAEERYLGLKITHSFSLKSYERVARTAFLEFLQQKIADKIFVVSVTLKRYYISNYDSDSKKFVLYPCLSSSEKFYFKKELRDQVRSELGVSKNTLYVYSGGIAANWHIPDSFLRLFSVIAEKDMNARLLVISPKMTDSFVKMVSDNTFFKGRVILKEAIPNHEVVKYLNAADFGILLRENNPVNNVAFPSKYAEYMLCGLPTIISEAVCDCAEYCKNNNSGVVLPNDKLDDMMGFEPLRIEDFNREEIANTGKKLLSKESAIDRIVAQLRADN